ncbi:MAG: hypothetical protein JWM20_348 [Patescibacteria group bacterium]|nr:hypothetical protein [Patescibacteria group bacterium]
MSKTQKFVALAAVAFAFAFAVSTAFATTWDFGSSTIKSGSTGTYAMNVQTALNACNNAGLAVDGKFGPHSAAAAMAFQASKGLSADGKVGPATKAALNNCGATVSTGTTGTVTCPVGYTCVSTGTTGTVSTGGPLSINQVTAGSGYTNTNVGVGSANKQVADLRIVTGAGGAGNLTGLNLTFTNVGSGDYQFIKYASSVGVWMNGVQIGSLPATSFTQYNSAYSAYIPLSGATLNPNTTSDLYISVSALPVIDSSNLGSTSLNNFAIAGVSLRYSDATGSAFQYTVSTSASVAGSSGTVTNSVGNFTFSNAASANSIKLTVTKNVNDSTDRTIQASTSSNTQSVTLAMIDLNAQGSNVNIQRLPVTVGVYGGSIANVTDAVSTLRLFDANGTQLDSESVPSSTLACSDASFNSNTLGGPSISGVSGAKCATVIFQNFNNNSGSNGYTITSGSTQTFTIKADINALAGNFAPGTYVVAEVTPTNINAAQAYDSNNNLLPQNVGVTSSLYLLGSTTGSKNYFYANSINVTSNGTATNSYSNPGGSQSHGVFSMNIPFSVTAYGTTAYIPQTAVDIASATAAANVQFSVDNGSFVAGATGIITYQGSDSLVPVNGNYQIPVGQTKNFLLTVTFAPSAAGSYRAALINVNWNNTNSNTTYNTYTAGLTAQAFKTPYVAGQ